METLKTSVVIKGWREGRNEQAEHRGILGH